MKFKSLLIIAIAAMTLSSCSIRLVDFTVISSKNVNLDIDRAQGVKTEGKKSYFLGIGWNIKDAMDEALEEAGPEYDMLIDGVVRYTSYPFVSGVTVEGTAVSTRAMKDRMGEAGFQDWLKGQNVLTEETAVVIPE
ncbi:hypothetical protein JM79_0458 [Gramella sp. Hel_I_59]|uniref:hypothetical protein n=1 Tax=unclassified Christiangramia TaxID=2615027 RepID=UPI0011506E4B|nr:hypothetical protein [Gramella sp. Hel_I_59]TQI69578.1 hypothetical protein JM79_0458 [Gramella sp. Hel_I_59]|tara:strand:- start:45 stop:452 length:408 start_codon:yes stop_codon:yes gene_type:complete